MLKTFAVVLLLFTFQQELPEYGNISELKDKQKVYLATDSTDARNMILKELKKSSLTVVSSPDVAEFILEYKVIRTAEHPGPVGSLAYSVSEMTAYTKKEQQRRILWSKTEDDAGLAKPNEINLTRNFIKALKKAVNKK